MILNALLIRCDQHGSACVPYGTSYKRFFEGPEVLMACPAGLATYEASRHLADARAVSLLSAYVHHGQLSPRLLMHETVRRGAQKRSFPT